MLDELEKSETALLAAIEEDRSYSVPFYYYSLLALKQGRYEIAETAAADAIERYDKDPRYFQALEKSRLLKNAPEGALGDSPPGA